MKAGQTWAAWREQQNQQLALPIQIKPKAYAPRIVTVHLPSEDANPSLTLCAEACTRDDPVSDNPEDCNCLDCLLIYERQNP